MNYAILDSLSFAAMALVAIAVLYMTKRISMSILSTVIIAVASYMLAGYKMPAVYAGLFIFCVLIFVFMFGVKIEDVTPSDDKEIDV